MTMMEEIEQENQEIGRIQGMKEGRKDGVQKTALGFLKVGTDPQIVSKVTGLPISQLKAMLKHQKAKDDAVEA